LTCLRIEKFKSKGKTFLFNLNEYCCYGKKDKCHVQMDNLDLTREPLQYKTGHEMHCVILAECFLRRGYEDWINRVLIQKNRCGHYSIIDGQHRLCISSKIDVPIIVYETEHNGLCTVCSIEKENRKIKFLNIFRKNKVELLKSRFYLEKL
jgi:hypothetical protein